MVAGAPALVSVFVRIGDRPPADTNGPALESRVRAVRGFAATDPGLTELSATVDDLHAQTTGDPFATAEHLTEYLRTDPSGVTRLSAR